MPLEEERANAAGQVVRAWGELGLLTPACVLDAGQSKINVKLNDGKGIVTVDLKKVKELYTVNPRTKCASCSVPSSRQQLLRAWPVSLTHPCGLPLANGAATTI